MIPSIRIFMREARLAGNAFSAISGAKPRMARKYAARRGVFDILGIVPIMMVWAGRLEIARRIKT
jgi:hypothetical protein